MHQTRLKIRLWMEMLVVGLAGFALLAAPTPGVGPEEVCGTTIGVRPSIAVDSALQPHIITDIGSATELYVYHKINGQWSESLFAKSTRGGQYNASRLYMPHIEIDSRDRAWISCKFGCKEFGTMLGQGLWLLGNVRTNPNLIWFRWVRADETHKGNGNVALDPFEPNNGVVLATKGIWIKVDDNAQRIASGNLNSGDSGEKIRFLVSPRAGQVGVWHTVMGGYVRQSSAYQNSLRNRATPVTWAEYGAYREMESDFRHPGIGIDLANPEICYMGAYYNPGLVINIWTGNGPYNGMLFDPWNLPVVDPAASRVERFGPQWTPVPGGGAFVAWSRGGRVKMRYIASNGTMGPELDICAGKNPSACTDRNGNIHLVYINGGTCYRLLTLGNVTPEPQPVAPRGIYTCEDSLTFTWSPTSPPVTNLRILCDGQQVRSVSVTGTSWNGGQFAPGIYEWQIKTNRGSWSASATFTVAPRRAVPLAPVGPISTPEDLQFEWLGSDCTDWYFVNVTRNGIVFTQQWVNATSWLPDAPATWPAGDYQWWIGSWARGCSTQLVQGPVSQTVSFQIACPAAATLTSPANGAQMYATNRLTLVWRAVTGASRYEVRIDRDGTRWTNLWNEGTANTTCELYGYIVPGDYRWMVQTENAFCEGPWTQFRTFRVNRNMSPSRGVTLWDMRPQFNWSPTPGATQYYLWINRVGKSAPYYRTWLSDTNWVPNFDMAAGTYNWKVQPWDSVRAIGPWLNWATFSVARMVPPRPVPISPSGAITHDRPLFDWEEAQYAASYQLLVKRSGTTCLRVSGVSDTSYMPSMTALTYGSYQWWVRGWSPHGYGPWSSPLSFTYGIPGPVSPTNGAVCPPQPTLVWTEVPDATSYTLRINRNSTGYLMVTASNTEEWTPTTNLPPGNYQWWVRAWKGTFAGPWSQKAWFTIP
ncbi:MAG: hypothetical protein N2255_06700 [Kiritimatiellae bacterium]|nr:hypothetical protein [Kiritimatiellia bacterium]